MNAGKTIIKHPFGNSKHTNYTNGDDWGMIYGAFHGHGDTPKYGLFISWKINL
jgi:hypothetical protein